MANTLTWKEGEGYDIHVLRCGPSSKVLDNSFDIDPQFPLAQFPLEFVAHFKGAPDAHGVKVDTATGKVTASVHPDQTQPKLRNFLVTARQQNTTLETVIRIHVHDSIQKIWLTPSTLTVHLGSFETRFTVLALFDDGVVGDITDWPDLKYASSNQFSVEVNNVGDIFQGEEETLGGRLLARPPGDFEVTNPVISVDLKLPCPATDLSASAKAFSVPSWADVGKDTKITKIKFVAGPVLPNEKDISSQKNNSVESVVKSRVNILFIAEGFSQSQTKDFKEAVEHLVKTGLGQAVLEPFKLLKGSINYWSLFVRSEEAGISLFGDHELAGTSPNEKGIAVPRPEQPPTGATSWTVENMIHQVGLPVPQDPTQGISAWVTHWKKLYDTQVTAALVTADFSDWNALRSRSVLNERDSAFGMAHGIRARVSDAGGGDPLLRSSLRRPTETDIQEFIDNLNYGTPPPNQDPHNIGQTWATNGKDRGLVCFVCLSDIGAGEARPGYFTASTGFERLASLTNAANGKDIKTAALSDPKAPYSKGLFASRVAHECGHAFGLGDEYGPGSGAILTMGVSPIPNFPNLTAKVVVTSAGPNNTTIYHPEKIKWRWPRAFKVSLVENISGIFSATQFQISLVPGHGNPFVKDDLVVLRETPLRTSDPFIDLRFVVDQVFPGAVDVTQRPGAPIDFNDFDPGKAHVLICANRTSGVELALIADSILNHIGTTPGGPLNAPKSNPAAACVASDNAKPEMTPTNLPQLIFKKKKPPAMADIIGIYEGGGHFDCGIFRPAGRCKMRSSFQELIPFCQVCRYLIVDRVDPTKLVDLDKTLYDPYYPT